MSNFAPAPKEYPIVDKDKFITRPWTEHFSQMSAVPQPVFDEFNDSKGRLTLPWLEWFHKIQVVPWPPLATAVVPGSQPGDTDPPGGGMTSEEFAAYIEGMGTGQAGGLVSYGLYQVTSDCSAAHPGFNGWNGAPGGCADDIYLKDSIFCFNQVCRWLCGKDQGTILLCQTDPPSGVSFGPEFVDAMEGQGWDITLTANATKFNGYEPLDYDIFGAYQNFSKTEAYHGYTEPEDKIDYILDNRGAILAECSTNFMGPNIIGYGVDWSSSGAFSVEVDTPRQKPVTGSIFYPHGTIYRVFGNSPAAKVHEGSLTKGGVSDIVYSDNFPTEGVWHWWRKSEG